MTQVPGPPLPVPWHLGALHGYEQALVLLLAFGPFVVLAVVVAVVRRRDLAAQDDERSARDVRSDEAGPPEPDPEPDPGQRDR